ncbi:MAG: hypothetical protein AAGB12_12000 [Pseudomonadota bacterium]
MKLTIDQQHRAQDANEFLLKLYEAEMLLFLSQFVWSDNGLFIKPGNGDIERIVYPLLNESYELPSPVEILMLELKVFILTAIPPSPIHMIKIIDDIKEDQGEIAVRIAQDYQIIPSQYTATSIETPLVIEGEQT